MVLRSAIDFLEGLGAILVSIPLGSAPNWMFHSSYEGTRGPDALPKARDGLHSRTYGEYKVICSLSSSEGACWKAVITCDKFSGNDSVRSDMHDRRIVKKNIGEIFVKDFKRLCLSIKLFIILYGPGPRRKARTVVVEGQTRRG